MIGTWSESRIKVDHSNSAASGRKLGIEDELESYSWLSGTDSDSTVTLALLLAFALLPVSVRLGLDNPGLGAFGFSDARAICHAGIVALPWATPEALYRRLRTSLWSDI